MADQKRKLRLELVVEADDPLTLARELRQIALEIQQRDSSAPGKFCRSDKHSGVIAILKAREPKITSIAGQ